MPNPRLAARYAKSIIGLAIETNQLEKVYTDMLWLQSVCKNNRDFVNVLRSPIINAETKKKIIGAVMGERVSDLTTKFMTLLFTKGREIFLPEIISAFTFSAVANDSLILFSRSRRPLIIAGHALALSIRKTIRNATRVQRSNPISGVSNFILSVFFNFSL